MDLFVYLVMLFLNEGAFEMDNVNQKDLVCMARNVYHEARGEHMSGKAAVAQVVMNRVQSSSFPDDVCGVIDQPYQFQWTHDGRSDKVTVKNKRELENLKEIISISAHSLAGHFKGSLDGATYFYNAAVVSPCWENTFDDFIFVGNHTFALNPNGKTTCYDMAMNG